MRQGQRNPGREFAAETHRKAAAARKRGVYDEEIVPVSTAKGGTIKYVLGGPWRGCEDGDYEPQATGGTLAKYTKTGDGTFSHHQQMQTDGRLSPRPLLSLQP